MASATSDFPYPLSIVPGAQAEAELERLMRVGKSEGFSPVILGNAEELGRIAETMSYNEGTVPGILALAEGINAEEWFRKKMAEYEEDEQEGDAETEVEPGGTDRLTVPFEVLSGKPHAEVYVARIPTTRSWEIPGYLKAGGWNDCPEAEVQVAISRHWNLKYGAELACLSGDVAEYLVADPPTHEASADELAREQYLYCGDIVWQGVGNVSNLSKTLLRSRYWYFWWD
jgi:hypothetical protein